MFSETNRVCCSEESGTASSRVEPGASFISNSQADSALVIAILKGHLPYKRMTIRRLQACSPSIGCATLKSYMRAVAVIGIGKTAFGAFADRDIRSLAVEAGEKAIADAHVTASKIEAFYLGNFAG